MILVDSSVWIDFFRNTPTPQAEWLDAHLGDEGLVVGDLILAEVLRGFKDDRGFNEARRLLARLEQVALCGEDLAVEAARNFRRLRSRGVTVRGTIDVVIATRCISDGLRLLHSDRDFDPFVEHLGLRIVDCGANV
ncbi:type II toxin-antitoxin system VapC family toxin [Aquabacterium sp. OR-4]|uniref:type II toxin-antitoxin system VapC family toxin n=1 Tax=Aquabacterium sp. OR-4 TaxID=2978127 RepID=UPI0021B37300|nr:PIN domain nuclease [Aquabacterium sp. OR-4]MDT7838432.1 PIN domain nuclease [Aquabacterium sp. OR-4]